MNEQEKSVVKFQYIRPKQCDVQVFPKLKNLCITVGTRLEKIDDQHSNCYWSVAFKHPKDKFDKNIAREAVKNAENSLEFSGAIILFNTYNRNEILIKIITQLLINETSLTSYYRLFIRQILFSTNWWDGIYRH